MTDFAPEWETDRDPDEQAEQQPSRCTVTLLDSEITCIITPHDEADEEGECAWTPVGEDFVLEQTERYLLDVHSMRLVDRWNHGGRGCAGGGKHTGVFEAVRRGPLREDSVRQCHIEITSRYGLA